MAVSKKLLEEYFNQRHCARCNERYRPGSVKIIEETESSTIARITCTCCELPLGTALVGAKEWKSA